MSEIYPLVSVTITTFNRAHLLRRCIDSVLTQDYPNIEIIIVDDHSLDETPKILKNLADKHDYLRYIRHEYNRGNAFARNTAWQAALGKYVAFMDDDDYWTDDEKLSVQISTLEQADSKVGICCTQVTLRKNGVLLCVPEKLPPYIKPHILKGNGVIHNSTVVIPRGVLESVGGFDERMPRGIDSEFYRNAITRHGYEVLFIPRATTYYETEGDDRITTRNGIDEAKRLVFAHAYLLWKYRWQYFRYPKAMMVRVKSLIKTLLLLIFR